MNYEKMWNTLKSDIKKEAATPIPDCKNIVTATASVSKKSTYFEILNNMEIIEKLESALDGNRKKYEL